MNTPHLTNFPKSENLETISVNISRKGAAGGSQPALWAKSTQELMRMKLDGRGTNHQAAERENERDHIQVLWVFLLGKCEGSQLTEFLNYRENGVAMYKNSNELHK